MIPPAVSAEVLALTGQIAKLEAEEMRLGRKALDLIRPHLTTYEACVEALDMLPIGYVTFCVRRIMFSFENENSGK